MTRYFERDISQEILAALKSMPVVVLTGLRQTGKSTFLQKQKEISNRRYITFDDFAHLEAAREDPDGLVDSKEPLTIDEAQKCPEILIAIKKRVDKKRTPGQYLLSGSANFNLLREISESLAGRAIYFTLHPFTRREMFRKITEEPFLYKFFVTQEITKIKSTSIIKPEDIFQGGMPSVCLKEVKNRLLWFKGFEQTYLERDVRGLSQIGNIISFRHLLHLIALRTGQLLSPSQLGRDAKLNVATTSRYLSILEASFIINRLEPYLKNRASRLIKSSKLYLTDAGLAAYLAGISNLKNEPFKGAILETYIAQNLTGIIDARWPTAHLYFWNIQGRHEIDFVIESDNRSLAIEIKGTPRWEKRDLLGLRAFISMTPHCIGGILAYNGTECVKLGERLWAIPLNILLS